MNDRRDPDTAARLRGALDRLTAGVAEDPPGLDTASVDTALPRRRWRWAPLAAAAVAVVGAAAIVWIAGGGGDTQVVDAPTLPATDPPSSLVPVPMNSVPNSSIPSGPVELVTTVLESPDHGPRLCRGVELSYPPQCRDGADITNWDWSDVEFEEADGTRWGEYLVVGSYELVDGTFTVEAPARAPNAVEPDAVDPFTTPCPAPPGGWPEMSHGEFIETDFVRLERAVEGFAGMWVDEPNRVVVVRVVGDQEAARAAIAEIFDGGICVTGAEYTMAELNAIQESLRLDGHVVSTGIDVTLNRVVLLTQFPDPDLEARLAEQHGDAVVVRSEATPIEPAVGTAAPATTG